VPRIEFRNHDGASKVVEAPVGCSIMRAAVTNGVTGIVAECGGGASCATCHVYIDEAADVPPLHDLEDELLDATVSPRETTSRLSCQIPVTAQLDGLVVLLPEKQV
jgi:2Fe-2S ferredoxin